jgi:hypothetical protein
MRALMPVTWMLSALLTAAACTSSAEPQASEALSAAPTATQGGTGDLPPGCVPIDLRAPNGERIELNGAWAEVGMAGDLMTWWIRTEGDCVWGAGYIDEVPPEGSQDVRPDQVQSLAGRLGADLVITGEIISLGAIPFSAPADPLRYSPLRMLIDVDDAGDITLREDRQPGVTGPRCPDPAGYCPAPLVLQPID